MSIKVILFRRVPAEKVQDLKPLLLEMRSLAMAQRGYISGETLMNEDDPEEYLVISSWTTKSRWNEWFENPQRAELQEHIFVEIDVQQVSLVICYDLPSNRENYIHRIGRSGRFGRKGIAINFVRAEDEALFKDIEQFYRIQIPEMPANVGDLM